MGKDLRRLNKLIKEHEKGKLDLMSLVYKAYLLDLDDSNIKEGIDMNVTEELKVLPNLTELYMKKRIRQLRLTRLEEVTKCNKLTEELGALAIDQERKLIVDIIKEIEDTYHKIDSIALAHDIEMSKL